jgi:HEXXH motif-containing protein
MQYAKSMIDVFVERFATLLNDVGIGATDLLAKASLHDAGGFEIFWSSAPATILQALQTGESFAAQRAAAEVLLHSGANGLTGDWEIRLEQPSIFLWDSWLLPKATRLVVQNNGSTARILASLDGRESESRLDWSAEDKVWRTDDLKQLPRVVDDAYSVTLLLGDADPGIKCDNAVLETISPAGYESISRALGLMREVTPTYYTWVTRVLRRLVIVEAPEHTLRSGNQEGYCGTFYVSECLDPVLVAEMFVHESSHQYYNALVRLEDVTDKSDQTMYYSPFVRRERTLDRLVLAYHAFANVLLFYRECFDRKVCRREDRQELLTLENDLAAVEQAIMASDKLTPVGRALVEPLYREMHNG